jgi:hypothetical protein
MKALWEQQKTSLSFYGRTFMDAGTQRVRAAQTAEPGVSKQTYIGSDTPRTQVELEKRGIEVGTVEKYDERHAGSYASAFSDTPQVIEPGSKVTLIEKDGIVQFYRLESPSAVTLPTEDIEALEARKAALELDKTSQELQVLETQKRQTESEITTLRQQLDEVRTESDRQQALLVQISAQNRELTTGLTTLRTDLDDIRTLRAELSRDIARDRPVRSLSGVSPQVDTALRELDIRTVEELSKMTAAKLVRAGIDEITARKINTEAKAKLREA